jgi:hypothetical protein
MACRSYRHPSQPENSKAQNSPCDPLAITSIGAVSNRHLNGTRVSWFMTHAVFQAGALPNSLSPMNAKGGAVMGFIRFPLCPVVDIKNRALRDLNWLRDHMAGSHLDHYCLCAQSLAGGFIDKMILAQPRLHESVWQGGAAPVAQTHELISNSILRSRGTSSWSNCATTASSALDRFGTRSHGFPGSRSTRCISANPRRCERPATPCS